MRLVAGVLHITGVASNCYAGDKMVCMQINTKNQNAIYSTFGSATFTIPANSTMTVEVPYTVPSGYKKITLIDKGVGDARCYVADWSAGTGNSAILKIANTSNSKIATSASIRFLCCKS